MYIEPRMYVELYSPHFMRAFSQKNYEVTARSRVIVTATLYLLVMGFYSFINFM
jgi:hypothetical protein